jgi:C-terminal processing protease CtpA/Prc
MGETEEFIGQGGWRNEQYIPSFKEAGKIEIGDVILSINDKDLREIAKDPAKLKIIEKDITTPHARVLSNLIISLESEVDFDISADFVKTMYD